MEYEELKALIELFDKSTNREMKIINGDFQLHLSKNEQNLNVIEDKQTVVNTSETQTSDIPEEVIQEENTNEIIKSPLVGSVYLQPSPDEPKFVELGQEVKKGDVVCVIEAMKMITEIKATVSGTIEKILVVDEELVEFDEPLFEIKEN